MRIIDEFERVAKRIGVTHLAETAKPSFDNTLKLWREGDAGSLVKIDPNGGTFKGSADVNVSTHLAAVKLTCTLDGSEPQHNSTEIKGSVTITDSCTLKVGMFMLGSSAGDTVASVEFVKLR